jgi:hypothetical protein
MLGIVYNDLRNSLQVSSKGTESQNLPNWHFKFICFSIKRNANGGLCVSKCDEWESVCPEWESVCPEWESVCPEWEGGGFNF